MKSISKLWIYALLMTGLVTQSCKSTHHNESANLVISDVTVINVVNGKLLKNQDVFISSDRIQKILPASSIAKRGNITIVNGSGKYLIPGLWDMHTHSSRANQSPTQFRLMLANGITGFRDMWGSIEEGKQAMLDVKAGKLPGPPRFVVPGNLVDGAPPLWNGSLSAPTPERGAALVDSLHKAGAPFIKVYSGLTIETYDAIAKRCKELNMPFVGHVPSTIPILHASQSGQRSIEHMIGVVLGCSLEESTLIQQSTDLVKTGGVRAMITFGISEMPKKMLETQNTDKAQELFKAFVTNKTWQVPTLVSLKGKAYMNHYKEKSDYRVKYFKPSRRWLGDGPFGFPFTEENWALAQALYEREEDLVGEMFKAGVPILAGTDAGTPWTFPGFAIHEELALFVDAGLTPLEALQTATLNPAKYFNRVDELGAIKEGYLADLVLLTANPLEDISNTKKINAVIADGRLYKRSDLDTLLTEVEQMVKDKE